MTRQMALLVKRVVDIVVAGVFLVILLPLFVVIGLAIRANSPGRILHQMTWVGRNGRVFRGYKFRSMVKGADKLKQNLLAHNEMAGPVFKMRDDPRVTSVGRILRKFSLDELPQLWNVVKGNMSLVGPRPVMLSEWEHFEDWQRRKLSVTPGMICLWHVNGKPQEFERWIRMDLEYIDNWSLWLDFEILLKTIPYMLLGRSC